MNVYIKYMVSLRCKLLVKEELEKLNIDYVTIDLGVVEVVDDLDNEKRAALGRRLLLSGLELLDDKKSILIEKVCNVVVNMVYYYEELPKVNYSEYISNKLGYDYTYLANTFSEVKGITIQKFIILNKIERVKELLLYNEFTLTEISYMMNYSSVAHLSSQFKKVTGLTPSFFKKIGEKKRIEIENV